jgi:hypothetical protein
VAYYFTNALADAYRYNFTIGSLEIASMKEITLCISRCDYVQYFPHVVEYLITFGGSIVLVVSSDPMFDLREGLFDGIEVG